MSRARRSRSAGDFDPLVAARAVVRDPRTAAGVHQLEELQREAVLAELQVMAELAEEALLPGDPDREAILVAYAAARGELPQIPAGR